MGVAVAVLFLGVGARAAHAQASSADVNAANNPLTPKISINLHDQWAPELYDLDEPSNAFLLRGPIPHKPGGTPGLGAGAGKVMVLASGTTINVFAEPQFTIAHDGAGQPKFQVFMGVTLQLPIGRR